MSPALSTAIKKPKRAFSHSGTAGGDNKLSNANGIERWLKERRENKETQEHVTSKEALAITTRAHTRVSFALRSSIARKPSSNVLLVMLSRNRHSEMYICFRMV